MDQAQEGSPKIQDIARLAETVARTCARHRTTETFAVHEEAAASAEAG